MVAKSGSDRALAEQQAIAKLINSRTTIEKGGHTKLPVVAVHAEKGHKIRGDIVHIGAQLNFIPHSNQLASIPFVMLKRSGRRAHLVPITPGRNPHTGVYVLNKLTKAKPRKVRKPSSNARKTQVKRTKAIKRRKRGPPKRKKK